MKVFNDRRHVRGVGVFVIWNNQLLLTHRIKGIQTGLWEVPTGHIHEGESAEATATREVLEETGLIINNLKSLGTYTNEELQFETTMFLASTQSGVVQNLEPRNHDAVRWFPLDKLPSELGVTTKYGVGLLP